MTNPPRKTDSIVVRPSSIAEAQGYGLDEMVHLHHAETMRDGIPLVINWPEYRRLERLGEYKPLAAFQKGRLVGYNAFFVYEPLHHMGTLCALNDVLYVDPDSRNWLLGPRLVKEADTWLKSLGVRRITYASKTYVTSGAHKAKLSDLLRKLGYTDTETMLEKLV